MRSEHQAEKPTGLALSRRSMLLGIPAVFVAACSSSGDGAAILDNNVANNGGGSGDAPTGGAANFRYDTLEGANLALSDLTDKPVVLNFFASWCPACIAEMPDFETVHQQRKDDVTFLGLATQDRPEDAQRLIGDTGVTYDLGSDLTGDIFTQFQGLGMPTTVFIAGGTEGFTVAKVHTGVLGVDDLNKAIDEELLGA